MRTFVENDEFKKKYCLFRKGGAENINNIYTYYLKKEKKKNQ